MFFCFFVVFVFLGLGNGRAALALTVIRWACLNIPMLFLFNSLFGLYGLSWAQIVADLLTVAVSYVWLFRYMKNWQRSGQPGRKEFS